MPVLEKETRKSNERKWEKNVKENELVEKAKVMIEETQKP